MPSPFANELNLVIYLVLHTHTVYVTSYAYVYIHTTESTGSEAKLICLKAGPSASRIAQWVEALASKPDDLNLTLQTPREQGKNRLPWHPVRCCPLASKGAL